jgi:hypothetical protein
VCGSGFGGGTVGREVRGDVGWIVRGLEGVGGVCCVVCVGLVLALKPYLDGRTSVRLSKAQFGSAVRLDVD